MTKQFGSHGRQIDAPADHPRPLIPSKLTDSRLFPGWGPRV